MSITGLLNIAGQSIVSHQIALNVTGSNIANVNTPGYSRQRVATVSSQSSMSAGGVDFGVRVDNITRVYDNYLESQIVEQEQNLGYNESRQDVLGRVEYVLNDTGSNGLGDTLNQFWNSWEALSGDPASSTTRDGVLSAGKNLASLISQKGAALEMARQDVRTEIEDTVGEINLLTAEIADLNGKIRRLDVENGEANDLVDRRMEAIKELSHKINISYHESDNFTIDVSISSGKMLVGGSSSNELKAVTNALDPTITDVVFTSNQNESLNSRITGGRLGGLIEMNEETLADYASKLNDLADGIVTEVNTQHKAGFDAAGLAGVAFFTEPFTGARNMTVNAAILADSQKIAASSSSTTSDGENARLLSAMRDTPLMDGATKTFGESYISLVGKFAYAVNSADSAVEQSLAASNQLASQREEAVGVSLDEEIMNLVKYQFGYNAAGKLAQTANEMLDLLMTIGQ